MTETLNDKIIIYQSEDGKTQLDVKLEGETVWLTQAQMVELFQTSKQNVSLHINNIYKEGELEKEATVKDYLTVQSEGARTIHRRVNYYNLDMIISVGYPLLFNSSTTNPSLLYTFLSFSCPSGTSRLLRPAYWANKAKSDSSNKLLIRSSNHETIEDVQSRLN